MKKIKKLCAIKKSSFDEYKEQIIQIVKNPSFICRKCSRVASDKKYLCKGELFEE